LNASTGLYGNWDEFHPNMVGGNRWYPTVVTMGDGDLIIISGTTANLDFEHLSEENKNPTYEYYPPRFGGNAIRSSILDWAYPHNLYPYAFQLKSGGVFLFVSNRTIVIDPKVDPGTDGAAEGSYTSLPDMPPMDHAPWIYP
jgi:hypothetical protein